MLAASKAYTSFPSLPLLYYANFRQRNLIILNPFIMLQTTMWALTIVFLHWNSLSSALPHTKHSKSNVQTDLYRGNYQYKCQGSCAGYPNVTYNHRYHGISFDVGLFYIHHQLEKDESTVFGHYRNGRWQETTEFYALPRKSVSPGCHTLLGSEGANIFELRSSKHKR